MLLYSSSFYSDTIIDSILQLLRYLHEYGNDIVGKHHYNIEKQNLNNNNQNKNNKNKNKNKNNLIAKLYNSTKNTIKSTTMSLSNNTSNTTNGNNTISHLECCTLLHLNIYTTQYSLISPNELTKTISWHFQQLGLVIPTITTFCVKKIPHNFYYQFDLCVGAK